MDLWRQIDIYCERTDPGFWSEPANAITNAAFLLAAALVWRRAAARTAAARDGRVLAALIGLIGAGSFLFHTLATVWAAWLDQGAIALYIYAFLWLFLVRVAGLPWWGALGGLGVFAVASRALTAPFPPGSLNGSYALLPGAPRARAARAPTPGGAGARRCAARGRGRRVRRRDPFRSVDQTLCASLAARHALRLALPGRRSCSISPRRRSGRAQRPG